ncbi:MAG: GTPase ObgE [Myxococcota bacterium]
MRTQFVDEATVWVCSGNGGNGLVAWRREKGVPQGGPAGGDGGRGGHVIVQAHASKRSLLDLRYRPRLQAQHGQSGMPKNCYGACGEDCVLLVPIGTQVFEAQTKELLADLTANGMQATICRGGRGGLGNTHFVSSTRQAPTFAQQGEPGQQRTITLSLKLMADVGLLGFPNAGKSTLLATMSAARPKIGAYPFTTLRPQLGVVYLNNEQSYIMADIPGLIEKSSEGAGLGFRFLKHLERVRLLCHLVEPCLSSKEPGVADPQQVVNRYKALRHELHCYSPKLSALPQVVVLTKCDLLGDIDPQQSPCFTALARVVDANVPLLTISSANNKGIAALKQLLWQQFCRLHGDDKSVPHGCGDNASQQQGNDAAQHGND